MKRTYSIIIISILVVAIAAYLYVHFAVLKIKDLKPGDAKPQSDIDFRPLIIAKLQQLVKDGSNGLYNLSVEKLEPDILQSELYALNATLIPDTAALTRLDDAKKAPDNVFKISLDSLHVTGISPKDFFHKDEINFDSVFITKPIIGVYHKPKPYNKAIR